MTKNWIGLGVLASIALLLSVDVSVLYLALPHLSASLGASAPQQLWIMDIYSFMLAGFLVTMGTLGDRIGRRRLLLIGAAAFGVLSVVAAFSTSAETLIVARALLGIAGATLMPSSMALIRNMFDDPKQMGAAIGIWFSCFMVGMAIGPLVGGLLLEHFWWGSAFLLGVPFMVAVLVAGPVLLPEYRDPSAGRLDLASVALSLSTILPVIYGLKEIARNGSQPLPIAAIVVGLAVGVTFVRRQRRLADPLLDLRLFANKAFTATLVIGLLGGIVMAGTTLMSTMYLQSVSGLSPLAAGLWLLPQNLVMIVALSAGPALARRVAPAYVMAAGLALAAAGLVLHTQVPAVGGIPLLVAGLVLASAGMALPMGLGTGIMMTAAPAEKAGSAASLSETSGEFGVAVGIAALGSLGTAVFRGALPSGVDADSITSAVAAAVDLDAVRAAFTSGLHAVAAVGALIFLTLAVVTAVVLRRHAAPAIPAAEAEPAMAA
ncbi:DHA2 family multidrug resistance protein-like MFS transporter [Streptosporangium album]|uniref:DHA2 family multidrug resistance protein-like MFS transporter n=1 Tax=Streptosporangium album TaxID=47479 RepID=A0A7W7RVK2_9ACTN|nr:MFS transporter [Streptosporangium album]MBB4938737.1 DHA2 family multidrug resistance protein-like MFS transporter [Streptosporangium album]